MSGRGMVLSDEDIDFIVDALDHPYSQALRTGNEELYHRVMRLKERLKKSKKYRAAWRGKGDAEYPKKISP